jgi:hypothetical protein
MEPVTDADIRTELTRALEKPGARVTLQQTQDVDQASLLGRGTFIGRIKRKLVIEVEW